MHAPEPRSAAIRPMACISGSFDLIRGQYWPLLGLCVVAMFMSAAVPLLLVAPYMCVRPASAFTSSCH